MNGVIKTTIVKQITMIIVIINIKGKIWKVRNGTTLCSNKGTAGPKTDHYHKTFRHVKARGKKGKLTSLMIEFHE